MATSRYAWVVAALSTTLLASCSHSGIQSTAASTTTATTSAVATNAKGRPTVSYDPCTQIPASVIAQQKLDRRPPRPNRSSDGETENNTCGYLAPEDYGVTVAASNYTLDMDKKTYPNSKALDIGGRPARSFFLFDGNTDTCAIDIAAPFGTYGVKVDSTSGKFGQFPDCLTAARAHLDAFLPYFPA
ncbi:Protein of uncharacterised function (DUF3558) [Mycobacteroides abscessus subsp. massiliense]|uniref:DUF3558 family protein n=1 Tax=Mycobacteroides abscessus TaxID=36809 RepID=UPI0009A6EA0A|nr:DUF3558 family protein [Mycobacteroides abscessus]SKU85299.1 Protein of uncharacterised function (DUF3558) [Mycobacteroides abscessus subsp. massiliense]SKU94235.1 Protein of uncharacterised function (DUF3558) [Mycobacteroides abscessus subsp. massiliense]